MNRIRIAMCAVGGLAGLFGAIGAGAGPLSAECKDYRPPPPPPTAPTPDGVFPVGGGTTGPITPGGTPDGPTTPGGETRGPATGGGRPGGGARPGGRGGGGGGLEAGHWTHWWYANRVFLMDSGVRAHTHAARTPSRERPLTDSLWRANAKVALATALSDDDDEIVAAAVLALGKAGDASDIPLVMKLAVDTKRGAPEREHATMALGLLAADTPADATAARNALQSIAADDDNSDRLRALALYALGLRQDDGAVPFLADYARAGGRSWDMPAASLSALGLSGCEAARSELESVLEQAKGTRQTIRRVYAAHGLAKLGDSAALPALLKVLGDDEKNVRRAAALAIGEVAPPADPTSVRALARVMDKDRDRGTRATAAVALGLLGGDDAVAILRKSYSRDDATLRPYAAVALGVIARRSNRPEIVTPLLRDLKRGTRQELLGATCVAVGLAGLEDAKPLLREIVLRGGNPQLVAQAAVSLGLIGDRIEGRDILRELLREAHNPMLRGEVALALGMLGDVSTLAELGDIVQDGRTEQERISGCVGLGRIGGPESAAVLIGVLADKKRSRLERHMAGNALGMLLDTSEGRRVGRVPASLNWYTLTPTVIDILQEM